MDSKFQHSESLLNPQNLTHDHQHHPSPMEQNHARNIADDDAPDQFPTRTTQEAKIRERIRVLTRTLTPVPFRPTKALDFARHETLLRRIGLWEFAHVEFDRSIRVDLLAQLIGSFAPVLRCGYVNGVRVLANRVQLGRVLKLPSTEKKKKGETLEGGALEGLNLGESIGFVEEFVRSWVVVHDDGDMIMMPSEVAQCKRLIREGRLERVDWGGLVWSMVEREMRDPELVKCHYASHLQLLIREQHEELLLHEEEEEGGSGDVRMGEVGEQEPLPAGRVNNDVELSLGGGDDFVGLQGEEDEAGWETDMMEESKQGEPEQADDDDEIRVEGMDEEPHHAMQAVETPPFHPVIDLNDDYLGDFMSHQDNHPAHMISSGPGSFVGNGHTHTRDIDGIADPHNTHPSLDGTAKRPRLHSPNSNDAEPAADFDICMDQIQHWVGEARSMYAIKSQSCEESAVNEQVLIDELCNRDSVINQLRKELLDESHKGQRTVRRLEKELHMMGKLAQGYREALLGAHKAFDQYRARCQQASDAAASSKGSVMEKKQPQLLDNCLAIEKHFGEFERSLMEKLQGHLSRVESYADRLLCAEGKTKSSARMEC